MTIGQPAQVPVNSIPVSIVAQLGVVFASDITVKITCGGVLISTIIITAGKTIAEGSMTRQNYTNGVSLTDVYLIPRWARLVGGRPILVDVASSGIPPSDVSVTINYVFE